MWKKMRERENEKKNFFIRLPVPVCMANMDVCVYRVYYRLISIHIWNTLSSFVYFSYAVSMYNNVFRWRTFALIVQQIVLQREHILHYLHFKVLRIWEIFFFHNIFFPRFLCFCLKSCVHTTHICILGSCAHFLPYFYFHI